MYGIDICNTDLKYCLLRAKPLCLTPDQHAYKNRLYEIIVSKSNHIIIDGFNPDEITETIIYVNIYIYMCVCVFCSRYTFMCMHFNNNQ